jgi:hypothetical protein
MCGAVVQPPGWAGYRRGQRRCRLIPHAEIQIVEETPIDEAGTVYARTRSPSTIR